LIRGLTDLPWRGTLGAASLLAAAGAVLVRAFVSEGPHRFPPARFDLRMAFAVFRGGGPRVRGRGCLAPMSGLYAWWAWIGVFLAESLRVRGGGSYAGLNASGATFLVIAIGALGCWLGGMASDRWGRTALTMVAMAISATCAAVTGFTLGGPPLVTLALASVWGITIIADSAQFSTAITELSPPAYVGTALPTQPCGGGGFGRGAKPPSESLDGDRLRLQAPEQGRAVLGEPAPRGVVAEAEGRTARLKAHRGPEERRFRLRGLDEEELGPRVLHAKR